MFVIADMPPLHDQQSGALRLFTLLELLHEAGWSLTFGSYLSRSELPDALTSVDGKARYEGALHALGIRRILYGETEIDAYLGEPDTKVDWAFISYPSVASRFMPLVRTRFPDAMIAFDMVDFHSLRIERQAELTSDAARFAEARRTRDQEISLALAADVTIAVTLQEKDAVLALAPTAVVKVLPNIFDVSTRPLPDLDQRRGIFFIGSFLHLPNGDSIHWFVDRIWPLIRAQEPDVELCIAGSGMPDDILAFGERPGIQALGYISEVPPLLDRHRVFVAPLRYGAGMKGKVGQSMANGLPVVATHIGAEGTGLVHGRHILIADEESAFANEVLQLLRDDDLWRHLSEQGRRHIDQTLSRSTVRGYIEDIFGA
ncbi:MAG: glycosyltransferase family 4 protein [Janthinobacterium lividum]